MPASKKKVKLIGCGAFEWNWKSLGLVWDVLEPGATGAFFLSAGQQTIIGELETLAVALSLLVWQSLPESVQLMVYIDNEGAKYSLIKDYSTSRAITALCAWAATTLDAHFCATMFARVPSISNIADYPSRQLEHPLSVKDTMIPMKK
jgi:hypothetical protein